jgi:hypothetical protein
MGNRTRFVLGVAVSAILALVGTQLLRAHPGGLDSCGGHNDHKHGGYHVHNMTAYCGCHPEAEECAKKKTSGTTSSAKPPASPVTTSPAPQRLSGGEEGESVAVLKSRIDGLEARVTILERAMAAK